MATEISKILKRRLEGENLSQVARELGISKSVLADWVGSRRLPSLRNIEAVAKLANYLGLTLEQLLIGRDQGQKIINGVTLEDGDRTYRIIFERLK
jgi:transcriptional regulator with XRE-family HTH domain